MGVGRAAAAGALLNGNEQGADALSRFAEMGPRARLVHHVQELERLEALKAAASDNLKAYFELAGANGYDQATLKVVLKLRKMTPEQRRDRRALEAIYMAALGMLEGDALPEAARRRLDEDASGTDKSTKTPPPDQPDSEQPPSTDTLPQPEQPPLALKDPEEARSEGADAAAAGKRIYENPYPAGDPCRAAWDEGWCAKQRSHGMDTPAAYQRRAAPPGKDEKRDDKDGGAGAGDAERGAA